MELLSVPVLEEAGKVVRRSDRRNGCHHRAAFSERSGWMVLPSPRPSEGADYDLVINTRSATRLDACMAMLKPKGVLACVGPCKAGGASAGGGLQAAEALAACFYRYHVQSELSTQGGQRSSYLGPYLPQEDAHDFARAHGICCEPAAEVYPIDRMDFALVRVRGDKGHRRVVVGVGGDASA